LAEMSLTMITSARLVASRSEAAASGSMNWILD
jgi:hypothetical protein